MKYFLFLLVSFLIGCNSGVESDSFSRIYIICVEGHQYYTGLHGRMAIKLNSDGKPIKCEVKK